MAQISGVPFFSEEIALLGFDAYILKQCMFKVVSEVQEVRPSEALIKLVKSLLISLVLYN